MRRLLFALAALLLAVTARAQVTITRVLSQGDPAPGAVGTFNGPQPPSLQAAGRVALDIFLANVPIPGVSNEGVWQGTAAGMNLVALRDKPLPSTGAANVSIVGNPLQNRSGATLFAGSVDVGPNFRRLFFSPGAPGFGPAQVAVIDGDAAPGVPGGTFNSPGAGALTDIALSDSGAIAFLSSLNGVPAGTNRALFTGDAATRSYTLVARRGGVAPLPGGQTYSFITTPSINGAGDVAFFSNLAAGPPDSGLFIKPAAGPLQAAVTQGDQAPGFPAGTTFTFFAGQNSGPPAINNAGQVAIGAGVTGLGGSIAGVWRGAPGALQLIARNGDPAPGHPNPAAKFNDFLQPLINRAGAVMFYANLINGAAQSTGIWIAPPAGQPIRLLTLLNVQAPSMPAGILLQSISTGGISFNNRGEGLINASMNYVVNSTPANGLFAGRPGRLRKVVASGDALEVAPGVTRTVISVLAWSWNSPDTGREISINDRGEVAFSCSFLGGGGGTFIARLPDPCPGDATGDDIVNFLDLNLVLSFFGQAVPPGTSGDLNGDGVVDFLDLNAVLSFIGASC